MALNGSELIDNPFNVSYSPFTDLFEDMMGNNMGIVFWFIPMIALTLGVYIKTKDPVMTSAFMIVTGSLLSASSAIFLSETHMYVVFVIFTAIGITSMFITLFLQRKGGV